MEIKAEQLEKDIEAIPGVCGDAKKAIKKLFENNFGVKFKAVRMGEVYRMDHSSSGAFLVAEQYGKEKELCLIVLDSGDCLANYVRCFDFDGITKKIADSPEEYFRKKFNGTL